MCFSSAICLSDSAVDGAFPSKAWSTIPSSRSPSVKSFNSAKAFRTLRTRFSIRTPVWTRSIARRAEAEAGPRSRSGAQ